MPSDDVGNGFDNQGEVLSVSPLLLEKYLDAAEEITRRAIVFDRQPLREQTTEGESLFVGQECEHDFHFATGRYEMIAKLRFGENETSHEAEVELLLDGEVLQTIRVGQKTQTIKAAFDTREGLHTIGVRFANDPEGWQPNNYDRRVKVPRLRNPRAAGRCARVPGVARDAGHRRAS